VHEEISDWGFVYSRHKFAYEYVLQFVENKLVIDVGCGTGYGCKILAERAELVYGIDYDAEAITYSREHYNAPNIKYFRMDAACLDLDRQFDIAVSFQVIEHMEDPRRFIQELMR
jgi:2-polyprenyl-3-methyl-5-hydroxy-6-metoxy-1,4-benzoquinol methylase